jgi:hypothetical protein
MNGISLEGKRKLLMLICSLNDGCFALKIPLYCHENEWKVFLFHLKPLEELLSPSTTIKLHRNPKVWRGMKSKNKWTIKIEDV